MPIRQDRLIRLIDIVDQAISFLDHVRKTIDIELDAAQDDFYANSGPTNALACNLLAQLQSIRGYLNQPMLSETALTTLITEREHFKNNRNRNVRQARYMQNRRDREEPTL